ncbi:MAG: hypothetical protein KAG97_06945, partial [Victivallales bacterium]|nr:hypothetical protein [Victivallales bacterium]
NINFNDLDLEVRGGREWMQNEITNPYSHADWAKGINTAFFCGRCDDLTFQNVRIKWSELTAPWKHSFIFRDSGGIQMGNVDAETPPNQNTGTNIKSENVQRLEQTP